LRDGFETVGRFFRGEKDLGGLQPVFARQQVELIARFKIRLGLYPVVYFDYRRFQPGFRFAVAHLTLSKAFAVYRHAGKSPREVMPNLPYGFAMAIVS
jgi:hypothetical protein